MALTIATCIQIKTIGAVNSVVSGSRTEDQLRDEILKWKGKYEAKNAELEHAEKLLEKAREKVTENDAGASNIAEQINIANRLLGLTALKGKGIIIKLNDNKTLASEVQDGYKWPYIVHDGDLREIVNDLKNAGAEAISVNGQRIVSTTGITCDGNVVRINGRKLSAPYEICAIGSPEGFVGALTTPGAYIENLEAAGLVEKIEKSNNVEIPKYDGVFTSKYISSYVKE